MASSPASSARASGPGRIPAPIISPRSTSLVVATPSSTNDTASANALSWKRSTTVISAVAASISAPVCVVALAGLLPELAGLHQLPHQRVDVEAVAVAGLQMLGDVEHRVQPEQVGQEEGPHRGHLRPGDLLVDLLRGAAALLLIAPDLGRRGVQHPVDHEPGVLAAANRILADLHGEVGRRLGRLLGGVVALD